MIKKLLEIIQQAGQHILSIYNQNSFTVTNKQGNSPVTAADIASHLFISNTLNNLYPAIPIISEESSQQVCYETRKEWDIFFLIDPLDGTKEFIQRNGEFTINIALIKKNKPVLGIIHAPALGVTYYAEENKGAYKISKNETIKLSSRSKITNKIRVVTSRSHLGAETQTYLDTLVSQGNEIIITRVGSALKFGLIADGSADIYPRLLPTMEWDTAAGQAIVNEVGKKVMLLNDNTPLKYNKISLINPEFIVQ